MRVYEIKSSSRNAFEKRIKAAKASSLRLTNAKQILDIEYTDLKLLLSYNPEFFDHCMKVADKVVAQIISSYKEMYADSEYEEDAEYSSYTFSMHGGDVKNVTLVFINHIMDSIIDRFGSDVVVSYHDETHSKVIVPVALSDAFYAWVFGLGKKIRITAPEEAIEGMKKLLTDVASRYGE